MEAEKVNEWVKSAEADGWVEYDREGLIMGEKMVEGLGRFAFAAVIDDYGNGNITMWGPDGLQTVVPMPYRPPGAYLLETCPVCGATGVKTYQYSFAGRACAKCLPEKQKEYEFPGWYN